MKQLHIIILCVTAIISGCAAPAVKTNSYGEPTQVKLSYDANESGITEEDVLSAISKEIIKVIPFDKKALYRNPESTTDILKLYGYELEINCQSKTLCQYDLNLYNGESFAGSSARSENKTTQSLSIPISLTRSNGKISAVLDFSNSVTLYEGRSPLFIIYKPLATENVMQKIVTDISKIEPTIAFSKTFHEELVIDTRDDIVYGNFKRTYGFYDFGTEKTKDIIGKESTFNLKTDQGLRPLKVDIYPSRDGSLLNYSFTMKFSAKPNGTTNFDAKDIEPIKASIKRIASI